MRQRPFKTTALGLMLFVQLTVGTRGEGRETLPDVLKVQLAYAAYSLDPRIYDDWSSVFVANHVFPRLLPDPKKPWLVSVARNLKIECIEKTAKGECSRNRIRFEIEPFKSCSGRAVPADEIKDEFYSILKAKTWLLPGWSECSGNAKEVCVVLPAHSDLARRLEAIYLRFGWSQIQSGDSKIGAGPYCLSEVKRDGPLVTAGKLTPKDRSDLPPLEFAVSQDPNSEFHFALQGTKDLLRASRKNVQPHTPLPYYVVSNPLLAEIQLPWNASDSAEIIRSHLRKVGMTYDAPKALLEVAPGGQALAEGKKVLREPKVTLSFLLPDYIPECNHLADELNLKWKARGFKSCSAVCGNLVDLMERRVHAKEVSEKTRWDGFLISLSPGAPERRSVQDQYFSPASAESLTGKSSQSDSSFYRIGMGQSLVTVDGRVLCDVAPTSLGLGDLTASDFVKCRAGSR